MMDVKTLALKIIKEQESIIGPLAWSEAEKVEGIDIDGKSVVVSGETKTILEDLVAQYELLFGVASREVCRQAVHGFIDDLPEDMIPGVLR